MNRTFNNYTSATVEQQVATQKYRYFLQIHSRNKNVMLYGYKNIKHEDGKANVIVDKYSSHIIQNTFELYATYAFSMGQLYQKINKDYGLKQPFYYGMMVVGNDKSYLHRCPTIISAILFEQAQQVKSNFNKNLVKYVGLSYIYQGLIGCRE